MGQSRTKADCCLGVAPELKTWYGYGGCRLRWRQEYKSLVPGCFGTGRRIAGLASAIEIQFYFEPKQPYSEQFRQLRLQLCTPQSYSWWALSQCKQATLTSGNLLDKTKLTAPGE